MRAKRQRSSRNFVMRGDIFDRNGIKLASDKISFDVYAHPADYDSSPEELARLAGTIKDFWLGQNRTAQKACEVLTRDKKVDG